MNRLLSIRSVRVATILVAMVAWLGATNHCALRCIEKTAHQCCCPAHESAPADHGSPVQTCCTSLRAVLQAASKAPEGNAIGVTLPMAWPLSDDASELANGRDQTAVADTGPPRAVSFAELVLQRCLLGHAPPSVV